MKTWKKRALSAFLSAVLVGTSFLNAGALSVDDIELPEKKYKTVRDGYLKDYDNIAKQARILSCENKDVKSRLTDGRRLSGLLVKDRQSVYMNFEEPVTADTLILRENLYKSGTIYGFFFEGGTKQFSVYASLNGEEKLIYRNDKIDSYRMCAFPETTFDSLRIEFDDCRGDARLSDIELYDVGKVNRDFRINDYFLYEKSGYAHDEEFIKYLDTVTDLTMFIGVGINDKGEVTYGGGKEAFAERLADVRAAIGDRDIKLFVTVYSADNEASFFTNMSKTLAKNLADFLVEFDLEGVDIDWEFPDNLSEWKAYSQFVVDIHNELVKVGKKISTATAVYNMAFTDEAKEAVDYFNIMVYDLCVKDHDGYHATFKHHTFAAERLILTGYDPAKICLGFPYYGRNANIDNVLCWVDYKDSGINDMWTNHVPNCDYVDRDGNSGNGSVYFNSYAMIRDKTAYAISMGVGGIMNWHMTSDYSTDNPLSLHNAVAEVCEQRLDR